MLSGTLADRDLGGVIRDLDRKLRTISKPEDYHFEYGGEYEEQQKAFWELTLAALIAITLVYMVMAAQFESLRDRSLSCFRFRYRRWEFSGFSS